MVWQIFRSILMFSAVFSFLLSGFAWADSSLKPYNLGYKGKGDFQGKIVEVKDKLMAVGFEISGEYSPYEGAHLLVITDSKLQQAAAKTEFGGYGAIQRVAITMVGDEIQVSSTNPEYMANVYRLQADLKNVALRMESALGHLQYFGSQDGFSENDLHDYHYMMFMPYFTDQLELARHKSYEEAIKAVELGLKEGNGGAAKVFRIDIPGKQQSLFGVALREGESADKTVMAVVDTGALRHTAHLPYELLVSGANVYALHGKFRIAQSFPDLTMGTFMQISGTPGAIEEVLGRVSGN